MNPKARAFYCTFETHCGIVTFRRIDNLRSCEKDIWNKVYLESYQLTCCFPWSKTDSQTITRRYSVPAMKIFARQCDTPNKCIIFFWNRYICSFVMSYWLKRFCILLQREPVQHPKWPLCLAARHHGSCPSYLWDICWTCQTWCLWGKMIVFFFLDL